MDFSKLLIMDGATGTNLQDMHIPAEVWQGREGCHEWLNLAYPQVIRELHTQFLLAGSQALETNTFGANRIIMAEYDLADRVEEINLAAVASAREAAAACEREIYVVGSMGPGTKLPTLGQIEPEVLASAVDEQARALLKGGVDALIIETSQDLLQVKIAVNASLKAMQATRKVPLMVSVTMESSGTMLLGSDISAVAATLEPLDIACLGLNCATGPQEMESHIRYLAENWPKAISCMPNQGLPEIVNGQTVYGLEPDAFAQKMLYFIKTYGVSVVGGCCGTTPGHIAALTNLLKAGGLL